MVDQLVRPPTTEGMYLKDISNPKSMPRPNMRLWVNNGGSCLKLKPY